MIDILKIIFYGILEGITEWLPISSTGHLIIFEEFRKLNLSDSFMSMFRVVIQLGAIMAVVILFFNKLFPISKDQELKKETISLWGKIIVSSIPAAILGLFLDNFLDKHLYNYLTVSTALILVGVLFLLVERKDKSPFINEAFKITYKLALIIGLFQTLALIPGVSRSGITIIGALVFGVSRVAAVEYSFFLGIPVMFGASLLKIIKYGFVFSSYEALVLVLGFLVAFLTSIFVIKFLLKFIKTNKFTVFAYYRIILGLILLFLFLIPW